MAAATAAAATTTNIQFFKHSCGCSSLLRYNVLESSVYVLVLLMPLFKFQNGTRAILLYIYNIKYTAVCLDKAPIFPLIEINSL